MDTEQPIYSQLVEFISSRMRLSHIYQPVMMMTLLRNQGSATVEEIAKEFLVRDESQIDYYSHITKRMPSKVLSDHGIVKRDKNECFLIGFDSLNRDQIDSLLQACQERMDQYLEKRGHAIFEHRKKSSGYISGTLRYDVLKSAKFRCELCGISGEEKALEVDHIVPRNKGGSDDISNLQALCYSCNAMKRDRDDTDFREVRETLEHRKQGCLFCENLDDRIIVKNELANAIYDEFPVTHLHTLIVPKRHIASYFDLGRPELNACNLLLDQMKSSILQQDSGVTGFNIGVNIGEDSGQTIFHCHIHLIPRRKDDVGNPRGGVRGVIPAKQNY